MITITLANGMQTVIDDCDGHYATTRWYAAGGRGRWYAQDGNHRYLHRLIMQATRGVEVDHINGDGLDNRRANLRIVTHQQNLANRRGAQANSRTQVRGVSMYRGRYQAQIKVCGNNLWLGEFRTIEDAEAAAQAARQWFFDEVAE